MNGKLLGIILLTAAGIAVILIVLLLGGYLVSGELSVGAALFGFVLGTFAIPLPLGATGAFLFFRGRAEAAHDDEIRTQRALLNMVSARGAVPIVDVALELNIAQPQVKRMLHDLVGKGLYTGYINWEEGILYSAEARTLRDISRCRHCNGDVTFAGKGIIHCPWCGTEYFL